MYFKTTLKLRRLLVLKKLFGLVYRAQPRTHDFPKHSLVIVMPISKKTKHKISSMFYSMCASSTEILCFSIIKMASEFILINLANIIPQRKYETISINRRYIAFLSFGRYTFTSYHVSFSFSLTDQLMRAVYSLAKCSSPPEID